MSVLYVCHGHPAHATGGGELAAWRLFETFRHRPGFEGSGFLAAASSEELFPPGSEMVGLSADEWLIRRSTNHVYHNTVVSLARGGQLHRALAGRDFRLIHLHHYLHVGIDLVLALKRWFPQARLLLTLHDYWGPCVFEGRLLKASGQLCSGGDPVSCDRCLGGGKRGELAIRALRLQRMFAVIDQLLCPSYFLKQQYLSWGVDPRRLSVIENLSPRDALSVTVPLPPRLVPGAAGALVLGYFGQVTPWKGLDLLIEAVQLARGRGSEVRLEVNGAAARQSLEAVSFNGPYSPQQLAERMAAVDWVVMASIWYENSPLVIQEAYRHGRPVLAPRLGGMAEKVRHGISGWLFEPDAIENLVDAIQCLCQLPLAEAKVFQRGAASMAIGSGRAGERHARLYRQWLQ